MTSEQETWHKRNLQRIQDTLYSLHAKNVGSVKTAFGVLSLYSVNGRILLVQEYLGQNGVEVFAPLSDSMLVAQVEKAIREYAEKGKE